jgi:ABC-type lipoprotein release transport system permease subunit
LFEVSGNDVGTLAAAAGALAVAALVAGLIPARRAASTDPVKALRSE